jgi:hypothetical protein
MFLFAYILGFLTGIGVLLLAALVAMLEVADKEYKDSDMLINEPVGKQIHE